MIGLSVPAKVKVGIELRVRGKGRYGGDPYTVVKQGRSRRW